MVKADFAFTPDGDLVAGEPAVDEEGNIMYYHPSTDTKDTDKGSDGIAIHDIAINYALDVERQLINNRLLTDAPDWFHYPDMGANLSDLVGEPNTQATGMRGEALIQNALIYEGYYNASDVNVRAVPISSEEILFMIFISKPQEEVRVPVVFNLTTGLLNWYEYKDPKQTGIDVTEN